VSCAPFSLDDVGEPTAEASMHAEPPPLQTYLSQKREAQAGALYYEMAILMEVTRGEEKKEKQ